jgi:hypothetical protein
MACRTVGGDPLEKRTPFIEPNKSESATAEPNKSESLRQKSYLQQPKKSESVTAEPTQSESVYNEFVQQGEHGQEKLVNPRPASRFRIYGNKKALTRIDRSSFYCSCRNKT